MLKFKEQALLAQADELRQSLIQSGQQLTVLIRSGKDDEALSQLGDCLAGIDALLCAFQAVGLDPTWLKDQSGKLRLPLHDLVRAIQNRDMVTISDSILYEIIPLLQSWGETIPGVTAGGKTQIRHH